MAQKPILTTGNDIAIPVTLRYSIDGVVQPLDLSGMIIKAAIVSVDRQVLLSQNIVSLSETANGADYLNSKVIVEFPPSETAQITKTITQAVIEIKVYGTLNRTWAVPVDIHRGFIQ